MIDRLALSLCLLSFVACPEGPAARDAPPPPAPSAPAPAVSPPTGRGPFLLWIYPRLSARLEGEQAAPLSRAVEITLDDREVRLGVRLAEGDAVELPEGRGRRQTLFVDLHELGEDRPPRLLHRFTLKLAEGPEDEPTDDLLRAETVDGETVAVELSRRGLRDDADVLEDEPEVIEAITLRSDEGGELVAVKRATP